MASSPLVTDPSLSSQAPSSSEPLNATENPCSTEHNEYLDMIELASTGAESRTPAQRVRAVGAEGLKAVLKALRDSFNVFPPLTTAVDGLLDIVSVAEVCFPDF
jgi:hypothetical protein